MLNIIFKFALALFLIDMVWIMGMKNLHTSVIRKIQKDEPKMRYWAGFAFYIVAAVVWYNLIYKQKLGWKGAALLGFGMYATYDLTMITAYKDYPVKYGLADMAWGAFAFGLAAKVVS